jgi:hypothetical protein
MKLSIISALFFIFSNLVAQEKSGGQNFDKSVFYAAMSSGKLSEINDQLELLNTASVNEKQGYAGALLMRKAGLVKVPAEKLKYFKKGRIKLETALLNDADNGEYHFLRLTIQEHAPDIVKYRSEIESDKKHVIKAFSNLSPAVQEAIVSYSKNSKILHPQDL